MEIDTTCKTWTNIDRNKMTLHRIAVETPQKHILRNDQRVESAALGLSGTAKCLLSYTKVEFITAAIQKPYSDA